MRITDKRSTQFQPALVLVGSDQKNDREEIKCELLKRVNAEGHKAKNDKIEVQFKSFQFPKLFRDEIRMIGMVVMVHRTGYDQTVESLLEMQKVPVVR